MATDLGNAIRDLRRAALVRDAGEMDDEELLERFVAGHDEAAFEALVRRHGPMVLGVCRRLLRHVQDVEDAFQATFLVLVRKAGSIARRELLGNFLYGVACRTASKARVAAARRCRHERQVSDMAGEEAEAVGSDVLALLDEELSRLPEKYRSAIVLCDLQDRPRGEAARRLGCPLGTVSSRLARGREILRNRLARRGVTFTVAALAAVLTGKASALPPALVASTVQASLLYAAGAGAVSAPVAALTEGVLKTMFLAKLKIVTTVVLALGIAVGAGLLLHARPADDRQAARSDEKPKTKATAARPTRQLLVRPELLRYESVQQELKLNAKQLRKIQRTRDEVRDKHQDELDREREASKGLPVGPYRKVLFKVFDEEHKALLAALPDILKDDQVQRLRQLSLQRSGVRAFTDPEVVKGLKLTDEQMKKVIAIIKARDEKVRRVPGRMEAIRKEAGTSGILSVEINADRKIEAAAVKEVVVDVLTEEQEKAWKKMVGKPFELKMQPAGGKHSRKKE
jgi:RNA polymerase sigma factor (sigma-70 family)